MPKNYRLPQFLAGGLRGPALWLVAAAGVLALADIAGLLLLFFPPGGTRADLIAQRDQLGLQIAAAQASTARLHNVSGKVQTGSKEAAEFENIYILPERTAYAQIIAEVQRMAKASGLEAREAAFSKEPIEGSDDLSVVNMSARFQGTYDSLLKFLNAADHSTMLLMLDTLQAAPVQKGGTIDAQIRFQAIMREDEALRELAALPGGQP